MYKKKFYFYQVSCVLRPQCEGGGGDGGWEAEPLDDLLPLLLIDDLHQASSGHDKIEQLIQIQDLLGHDGKTVNWSSYKNLWVSKED